MNAPTLYDRFILPEGQRKVTFVADTKVASAGTFTVQREDHTLGNLIRMCVRARACKRTRRPGRLCARWRVRALLPWHACAAPALICVPHRARRAPLSAARAPCAGSCTPTTR
jgi:DNA-directed RNA polymerase II subunit RPB11